MIFIIKSITKKQLIKPHSVIFIIGLMIMPMLILVSSASAASLANRLKGRILLQVEQSGESWYVNPADEKRYYMGRPADAFNLMRSLGAGITNSNLEKIQIADANLSGADSDNDGLSDMIEDSFGTDKNKQDTDGDGHNDKDEIISGYNPNGNGKLNLDINFANSHKGKIFLQVEQNGEAWYVNPEDKKRHYLGRPDDAFNVMRSLGLGITDNDLNEIELSAEAISALFFSEEEISLTWNALSAIGEYVIYYEEIP